MQVLSIIRLHLLNIRCHLPGICLHLFLTGDTADFVYASLLPTSSSGFRFINTSRLCLSVYARSLNCDSRLFMFQYLVVILP